MAMPDQFVELSNSSFMDYNSYGSNATSPPSGGKLLTGYNFNVALILERQNDPTALLQSDWGTRQAALADQATIWSLYGADPGAYSAAQTAVNDLSLNMAPEFGYVSSPSSRTVWVQLDGDLSNGRDDFKTLFNASLYETADHVVYWGDANGNAVNLSLPQSLVDAGVSALQFDRISFANYTGDRTDAVALLPQGAQSQGNAAPHDQKTPLFPQQIAQDHYNYPLTGPLWDPGSMTAVQTGTIGLIEPSQGDAQQPGYPSLQELLDDYRNQAIGGGNAVPGVTVNAVAYGGQEGPTTPKEGGERSLDVSIVTAVDPQSPLVLYAGSGPGGTTFSAYQSAFWDDVYDPAIITSSFAIKQQSSPASPFRKATLELFVDAALRNITVFKANGDGGSGNQVPNGMTNAADASASPYMVLVGGTSLSTLQSAAADATLTPVVDAALARDPATLWQLVAGGLTSMPSNATPLRTLIETVWNQYWVEGTQIQAENGLTGNSGYMNNNAGSGGVDPTQPVPWYQQAFGLLPTTADPRALSGRGTPDVAANAGGNMTYITQGVLDNKLSYFGIGTSAASPLWSALGAQINAVFSDQGLPNLGFMNDLLYTAAVIAPGSFNDVTVGNNISSFVQDENGSYTTASQNQPASSPTDPDPPVVTTRITPTGYGYSAGPGYDLVTGLGTPNGMLLARALTLIAHHQYSYAGLPDVIVSDGADGWQSGVDQSLLFQAMDGLADAVDVQIGGGRRTFFTNTPSEAYAWTSRMAQQSLQADFSPELVRLFDGQSQGALMETRAAVGDSIAVDIASSATQAAQATLSQSFGFADFISDDGSSAVRVAQSVAVAETAGKAKDQNAVIRMRQNGADSLSLELYEVDDYQGTVAGLSPGSAGYAAAAHARAYEFEGGGTEILGPGYGQYRQAEITGVDAGDLIAMRLTNNTSGMKYWAFAEANSDGGTPHLWNYGANIWGWEDLYGGGDRDYNDLVVQIDFTSTAGRGLLVGS